MSYIYDVFTIGWFGHLHIPIIPRWFRRPKKLLIQARRRDEAGEIEAGIAFGHVMLLVDLAHGNGIYIYKEREREWDLMG